MFRKSRGGQENTIAGSLNRMREEGRLVLLKMGELKVQWSLARDEIGRESRAKKRLQNPVPVIKAGYRNQNETGSACFPQALKKREKVGDVVELLEQLYSMPASCHTPCCRGASLLNIDKILQDGWPQQFP